MKPNIIEANNYKWIHDHKHVFMLVYSEAICAEGHTKMKELKARLRKYKIRHRIVEQEYPNEGHSPRMFWDIYVEIPYCRLPERFPERLLTTDCPPGSCPSNCYTNGIAPLHHGKDGKGKNLPDHIREINHIIFPRQQLEVPPMHPNTRCVQISTPECERSIYIFSPPLNIHSMDEGDDLSPNIQTIEIDIFNMIPTQIAGMYVPNEVRDQTLERMRRMLNDSGTSELHHGDFTRERIEGTLRRTIEVQTTELLHQRLERESHGTPPLDYSRRLVRHLSGLGMTYEEASESIRALGRASNSVHGSIGRTFRTEDDIPVVERLPTSRSDTEMVWIDDNRNAGYLYMSVLNVGSDVYLWDLVNQEVLQRLRPEQHARIFAGLCGFEPTEIDSSQDAGSSDIDMTFSDSINTLKIIVCPDGLISIRERNRTASRPHSIGRYR